MDKSTIQTVSQQQERAYNGLQVEDNSVVRTVEKLRLSTISSVGKAVRTLKLDREPTYLVLALLPRRGAWMVQTYISRNDDGIHLK
jgi:hypothetical protein